MPGDNYNKECPRFERCALKGECPEAYTECQIFIDESNRGYRTRKTPKGEKYQGGVFTVLGDQRIHLDGPRSNTDITSRIHGGRLIL